LLLCGSALRTVDLEPKSVLEQRLKQVSETSDVAKIEDLQHAFNAQLSLVKQLAKSIRTALSELKRKKTQIAKDKQVQEELEAKAHAEAARKQTEERERRERKRLESMKYNNGFALELGSLGHTAIKTYNTFEEYSKVGKMEVWESLFLMSQADCVTTLFSAGGDEHVLPGSMARWTKHLPTNRICQSQAQ